jgi:hypothetical protein
MHVRVLLVLALCGLGCGSDSSPWDATYTDRRFAQAYRVDAANGRLFAESTVAINVPVWRLRSELSQPWTWWTGGQVLNPHGSGNNGTSFDFYPTGRYFHARLTLGPVVSALVRGGGAFAVNGTSSGNVEGTFVVEVSAFGLVCGVWTGGLILCAG